MASTLINSGLVCHDDSTLSCKKSCRLKSRFPLSSEKKFLKSERIICMLASLLKVYLDPFVDSSDGGIFFDFGIKISLDVKEREKEYQTLWRKNNHH